MHLSVSDNHVCVDLPYSGQVYNRPISLQAGLLNCMSVTESTLVHEEQLLHKTYNKISQSCHPCIVQCISEQTLEKASSPGHAHHCAILFPWCLGNNHLFLQPYLKFGREHSILQHLKLQFHAASVSLCFIVSCLFNPALLWYTFSHFVHLWSSISAWQNRKYLHIKNWRKLHSEFFQLEISIDHVEMKIAILLVVQIMDPSFYNHCKYVFEYGMRYFKKQNSPCCLACVQPAGYCYCVNNTIFAAMHDSYGLHLLHSKA